ncbi:MAG: C69 family dipeptidase [Deltaproteobacteria bacterium]|nr:C69 family dipeptidase [Deltaproteobacteria bacterium]
MSQLPRVSCDSLVALAPKTRDGRTIFAKNSDRPAGECQPLVRVAAGDHRPGERLRCQYIEIDQVAHTHALLGARPAWLWGLEHGLNENGVAIGNHTIFTRDPVAQVGLLGMDLVRLGLERSATAAEAIEVLIDLIERYGQGGSGYCDTNWPYHNSFLVADPSEAFVLEASASHWALKRVKGAASASNQTTIGTDWESLGHDTIEHAIAKDWWPEPTGVRFDFAAAYRSTETAPPVISSGRYGTTCRALAGGALDLRGVMRVMRDHYDGGDVYRPGATPDDERYFSVCMHADPVGTTTASMVVELAGGDASQRRAGHAPPLVYWAALTNPCIAPYLPLFVEAELPGELAGGGVSAGGGGAWWRFKSLLGEVEKDFTKRGPYVRAFWRDFEEPLPGETARLIASLGSDSSQRAQQQSAFVADLWQRASSALAALTARVAAL